MNDGFTVPTMRSPLDFPLHRQADRGPASPPSEVLAEIGRLLAIHLAVALAICFLLDLCGWA